MAEDITPQPINLFYYRLNNWLEVHTAMDDLFASRDILLKNNDPKIKKIFEYFDPLHEAAKNYQIDKIMDFIDISTICFLQPLLIKQFLLRPNDPQSQDALLLQLSLLSASTLVGGKVDNITPYTLAELADIMNGDRTIYDDKIFAYTLRSLLLLNNPDDRVATLFFTLSKKNIDNAEFAEYFWEEAVIFSLTMQLIWKNLLFFNTAQQEFIIQNYFYSAVVAGVPVENWISIILSLVLPGFNNKTVNDSFLRALENSLERVPYDTSVLDSAPLKDLLTDYVGKIYDNKIRIFAQEKFIGDIYKDQKAEKQFSGWMRVVLYIYYGLRSGQYLPL